MMYPEEDYTDTVTTRVEALHRVEEAAKNAIHPIIKRIEATIKSWDGVSPMHVSLAEYPGQPIIGIITERYVNAGWGIEFYDDQRGQGVYVTIR